MKYVWHYLTAPFRLLAQGPALLVGAPQRLMGLSLPARVAVLMFISLLVLILTAFAAFYVSDTDPIWRDVMRPGSLITTFLLAAIIPILTYFTLKLWLAGDVAEFPDIDGAWREGVQELTRQGVDLQAAPLFLVLGVHDMAAADALMKASGMRFRVQGFPDRLAPLRWYGNDEAVFLFCTGVGGLSLLQKRALGGGGLVPVAAGMPAGGHDITRTLTAAAGSSAPGNRGGGGGVRDTLTTAEPFSSGGGGALLQGTLMPGTDLSKMKERPGSVGGGSGLSPNDVEEQAARTRFLARLLNRARQPYCPLNGVLTLVDWNVLDQIMVAEGLGSSVRRDLMELHQATELACPVTLMVGGMEAEPGFAELVRRVGGDKAVQGRFGKGFEVWNQPTTENLDALSSHACGAFEDWVYSLFRDPQALNKPNNGKLYALMCKIRGEMQIRIRNLLVRGFSLHDEEPSGMRLSGCYFSATSGGSSRGGSGADMPAAFTRSVLMKLVELEGQLDWKESARARDQWFHRLARLGTVLNGLLLVAVVAMLIYHFGWGRGEGN